MSERWFKALDETIAEDKAREAKETKKAEPKVQWGKGKAKAKSQPKAKGKAKAKSQPRKGFTPRKHQEPTKNNRRREAKSRRRDDEQPVARRYLPREPVQGRPVHTAPADQ